MNFDSDGGGTNCLQLHLHMWLDIQKAFTSQQKRKLLTRILFRWFWLHMLDNDIHSLQMNLAAMHNILTEHGLNVIQTFQDNLTQCNFKKKFVIWQNIDVYI